MDAAVQNEDNRQVPGLPAHVTQARYQLGQQREVCAQLNTLLLGNNPISAAFTVGSGKKSLATMLVGMHKERNLLLLDFGLSDADSLCAIKSGRLVCSTKNAGVPIYFVCEGLRKVQYGRLPAIASTIPETIYYVEQREYFRAATPASDGPTCLITEQHSGRRQQFVLCDISQGGVGFVGNSSQQWLKPMTTHRQCLLHLPDSGHIKVDLRICYQIKHSDRSGAVHYRFGAAFESLGSEDSALLQRYIIRLQQQALQAKRSGM